MMQTATILQQDFEPRNADILIKQKIRSKLNLDLRNIILLNSQSTMDLFCNPNLVQNVKKSKDVMKLQSNGGTMKVNHKAPINGYDNKVWFSKDAITNIIALSNLIKQYRVTYDSNDKMFAVHQEDVDKPNMEFKMRKSGLHYFNPKDFDLTFNINTVSDNKKGFTKRQVKGAEQARTLYATLGYPSIKDFKWVIQSNQIKDCPVTVQDTIMPRSQDWIGVKLRPHKKSRQRSPAGPSLTSHELRLTSYPMTIKNMNPRYSLQSPTCKNVTPDEIPGVRRSTRVKFQPKQD
jgi:hypothetical protein